MKHKSLIMVAIFLATLMTSIETTIITTAMPTIVSALHGLSMQSWIFTIYLLATAITTPIYGKLSDQLGRKPIFVTGILLFTVGSLLSGLASNMMFLILARLVQGIGAGAVLPITNTIIADLFTFDKRATALAFNNTAWGISALAGPVVGGLIVQKFNWHWIFFINVPIGLIVLLIIVSLYENPVETKANKLVLDYQGILTLSLSLLSLLMIFQFLQKTPVSWRWISGLFFILAVSGISFVYAERHSKQPLIDFGIFRNRTFTIQIFTAFILSGAQFSFQIYFPMWLQSIYKLPADLAGLVISPSPIMWLIASFFVGYFVKRYAPKYINIFFISVMIISYMFIISATLHTDLMLFYIISGISGLVLGMVITSNTLVAQQVINQDELGLASSMLTLGRTLGQTIMTGVYGLSFNITLSSGIKAHREAVSEQVMNQFVNNSAQISETSRQIANAIMLRAQHTVFYIMLFVLVVAVVINYSDSLKKPVVSE